MSPKTSSSPLSKLRKTTQMVNMQAKLKPIVRQRSVQLQLELLATRRAESIQAAASKEAADEPLTRRRSFAALGVVGSTGGVEEETPTVGYFAIWPPYLALWKGDIKLFNEVNPPAAAAARSPGAPLPLSPRALSPRRRHSSTRHPRLEGGGGSMCLDLAAAVAQLRRVPWFAPLSAEELLTLAGRARHRRFERYSVVLREGSAVDAYWVLLSGSVRVTTESGKLHALLSPAAQLHGPLGTCVGFGEAALVNLLSLRREASVLAMERCEFLQIEPHHCDGLPVDVRAARVDLTVQLLQRVPFFGSYPAWQLERLAGMMQIESFACGEVIFEQGAPGDKLYILLAGRVELFIRHARKGELPVGDCRARSEAPWFGELALYQSKPRSCWARAAEPIRALVVPRAQFDDFLDWGGAAFAAVFQQASVAFSAINAIKAAGAVGGHGFGGLAGGGPSAWKGMRAGSIKNLAAPPAGSRGGNRRASKAPDAWLVARLDEESQATRNWEKLATSLLRRASANWIRDTLATLLPDYDG